MTTICERGFLYKLILLTLTVAFFEIELKLRNKTKGYMKLKIMFFLSLFSQNNAMLNSSESIDYQFSKVVKKNDYAHIKQFLTNYGVFISAQTYLKNFHSAVFSGKCKVAQLFIPSENCNAELLQYLQPTLLFKLRKTYQDKTALWILNLSVTCLPNELLEELWHNNEKAPSQAQQQAIFNHRTAKTLNEELTKQILKI